MDDAPKPRRFDRIKSQFENETIKQHWQEHKREYITGASCLALGFFLSSKGTDVKSVVDAYKIQINSPTTNLVTTALERRACPNPIPVRDKFTGEPYRSFNRAAKVTGEPISKIAKDVHGVQERFERLPDTVFA